jgi:hypothetical protein
VEDRKAQIVFGTKRHCGIDFLLILNVKKHGAESRGLKIQRFKSRKSSNNAGEANSKPFSFLPTSQKPSKKP